jgi:uncharacterized protein DUF5666
MIMKSSSIGKIGAVITSAAVFTAVATLALGGTAFADSTTAAPAAATTGSHQGWLPGSNGGARRAPGVFGTVASISGDTITLTSKGFGPHASSTTPTTYTVDATNATVTKDNAASSVSAIAVGDMVMAQGTVSGTNVTATKIMDGIVPGMMGGKGMGPGRGGMASSTMGMHGMGASIAGNGEPVIGGGVTAISGTTLTVTNKSNVTYSVDASAATVIKGNATSSVSSIAVGDNVVVQGTVNGTAVTASSVMDQGAAPASGNSGSSGPKGFMGGVIGGITGFFQHLFGFF